MLPDRVREKIGFKDAACALGEHLQKILRTKFLAFKIFWVFSELGSLFHEPQLGLAFVG